MHANGPVEVCRREILRLALAPLAWAAARPPAALASSRPRCRRSAPGSGRWRTGPRWRCGSRARRPTSYAAGSRSSSDEAADAPRAPPAPGESGTRCSNASSRSTTTSARSGCCRPRGSTRCRSTCSCPADRAPDAAATGGPPSWRSTGTATFGHDAVVGRDETPALRDEVAQQPLRLRPPARPPRLRGGGPLPDPLRPPPRRGGPRKRRRGDACAPDLRRPAAPRPAAHRREPPRHPLDARLRGGATRPSTPGGSVASGSLTAGG